MINKSNRLLENILSMVSLRGMEYMIAVIVIPYLLRVLGPSNYGVIAFMQGIVAYFILIINYGFNVTAPKDIALSDSKELPRIFSSYFWATFFLWGLCTIIFSVGYYFFYIVFEVQFNLLLFFSCYMAAVGIVLFPVWFFQGIQKMRYITIFNLCGRLVTMLLLFYFVQSPEDYILAAFLQSCTPIFAGVFSLYIIKKSWPGIFIMPTKKDILLVYKKGWKIFVSGIAVNFYTSSDVVILGILTNPTVVGYYSGAEKLINCVRGVISAVSNAVYPYISTKFKISEQEAYNFLKKQMIVYLFGGVIGGVILFYTAPIIIPFLLGDKYINSISTFQTMSFMPLMVAASMILGYEIMLPKGLEKSYCQILVIASVLNLTLIVPAIFWKAEIGVAVCVMITETFITIAMSYILWRKNILQHII